MQEPAGRFATNASKNPLSQPWLHSRCARAALHRGDRRTLSGDQTARNSLLRLIADSSKIQPQLVANVLLFAAIDLLLRAALWVVDTGQRQ